jgi:ribose transport system substrate-binding protein
MRLACWIDGLMQIDCKLVAATSCVFLFATLCLAQSPQIDLKAWDGPTTGVKGQPNKRIAFLSQDFRNGGISSLYRSFSSAASILGWQVSLFDGAGDTKKLRTEFSRAIDAHQDAIIFGGFQADQEYTDLINRAKQSKIILAGWHAAAEPGPTESLFVNVATQSLDVATITVTYAIQNTTGEIGFIIFNDDRFAVANRKAAYMKDAIKICARCKLLSVENILISDADHEVPAAVIRLHQIYGKAWTHSLAINDVYFDSINIPLIAIGRPDVQNISAGDGSNVALSRINSGKSQQVATVAEPLGLQGWQLADELNRAFAGYPPSGYVSKPILITAAVLKKLNGNNVDGDIPYKKIYLDIWGKSHVDK